MGADVDAFLQRWHEIVTARDIAALVEVLAGDVTIGAPPYWNKLEGRDLVQHLLGLVIETIEGFTYHREWRNGRELALEFTGVVDGLNLQGIDLISLDDTGRVSNLDVLIRPHTAVAALKEHIAPRMVDFLSARAEAPESST